MRWFQNLFDARRKITAWRREYNEERPHSSFCYRTRRSSRRSARRDSPARMWGKGPRTPAPCPKPPSPLAMGWGQSERPPENC
ncbi:MAG: integrase core domain-containing protein [Terriglobales bacterium]